MKDIPPLFKIQRLLIVKMSSLGDVIHALPAVAAIKDAVPSLEIDWIVRQRCADLLQGCPWIHRLYVVSNRPSMMELFRLRKALHASEYPLALDLQGLALSGVITRLSGAPVRIGWDRNREQNARFLTHPIVNGQTRHVGIQHEIDLLYGFPRALSVHVETGEFPPQAYLGSADLPAKMQAFDPRGGPIVALNVGAAREYKRWPVAHWAELGCALLDRGYRVVFVGSSGDGVISGQVRELLPDAAPVLDLTGETNLGQLAGVLARSDLVVSGDTGPMHLAVAVGTPVVAVFGATDPRRHGPYGARHSVVCDPSSVTSGRPTPDQGTRAMQRITAAMVMSEVDKQMPER